MRNTFFKKLLKMFINSTIIFILSINISHSQKISLNIDNKPLKEILNEISRITDYEFVYSNSLDNINSLVSIKCKNLPIEDILKQILKNKKISFKIEKKNIALTPSSLLIDTSTEFYMRGIITDEKLEPLVGVVVQNGRTGKALISDNTGAYEINVDVGDIITFSYIGFKTKTLKIKNRRNNINITLQTDVLGLQDVVVTGYQTIDKKKLTSAIQSVKMDDIMIQGAKTINQMLEGRISDLYVLNNSGEVGTVPKFRIRGTSTLIGNREPLWVLDGIVLSDPVQISPDDLNDPDYINRIGNAIAGINPQDIERIDILKDASATALYGVKAANGVIVVTTKKGRIGKAQVQYNMNIGVRKRPRYTDRDINLMNSKERIKFSQDLISSHHVYSPNINLVGYEGLVAKLYSHEITQEEFNSSVAKMEILNNDWFKDITTDALSQQHTISISGGNKNIRYYTSLGYANDNDVIKSNKDDRYTAITNMNMVFSPKLSVSLNMNGSISLKKYHQPSISPIDYAYNTSRAIPTYMPNGEYYYYKKTAGMNYNFNIINELENSNINQSSTTINVTGNISYKIAEWLTARGILSYSSSNTKIEDYWGENTLHISKLRKADFGTELKPESAMISECPFGGELSTSNSENKSFTARIQLDANKYFGEYNQHNVVVNMGVETSSTSYKSLYSKQRGYYMERGRSFISGIDLDKYPLYKKWVSSNKPSIIDNLSNLLSIYASISYSYNNIIVLNANARIDGSNKFGSRSNEKLLPIWSISSSYNIYEHLGLSTKYVDYISIKTSYGYQGNMLDGQSPEMIIKKNIFDTDFNEPSATISVYPNPKLKWEKTNSFNVGLECSLLSNLLQLETSYYYKKTVDAFMPKTISTINGIGQYIINSGNIVNQGYSVDLSITPIKTDDTRLTLSTSIFKTYNKMTSKPDAHTYELEDFLHGSALVEGHPVGTFWSYRFIGLNPNDGGPLFNDMVESAEDFIGKSKYDVYSTVLSPSGSREPKLQGGINTTLRYKNFRLGVNLSYSVGAKVRLFKLYKNGINFDPEMNINKDLVYRWQKSGDDLYTDIPNIINSNSSNNSNYMYHWSYYTNTNIPIIARNAWDMFNYSDRRVVSGDYLKINNISFSYDFPIERIKNVKISALSLSLSCSNIFTFSSSKLKGQTPIQSGFTEVQLSDRPMFSFTMSISL